MKFLTQLIYDQPCLRVKRSLVQFFLSRAHHSNVRVRFAPSPTGHLHLGGLRTALYNFLFARAHGGVSLLRIEDTDQSRLVPKAAEALEDMLQWAKIPPDESPMTGGNKGPYVQSLRSKLYQEHIQTLLKNGTAYKCFCSEMRMELLRKDALRRREVPKYDNKCRKLPQAKAEELERQGVPYCIRLQLEHINEPFMDLVYGPIFHDIIQFEGDPVLMKSDGFPTYHFANVVDDHLMEITHVLRGVEWQVSTPKHLLLYKAFGWEPPQFAHLPLIKNKDGSKLSKRQGDLHIANLRKQGYSPEAILNFVTDIGGGFEDRDQNRVLTVDELADKFNLSRLNTHSCRLEVEKLGYFNQLDIQRQLRNDHETLQLATQLQSLVKSEFKERLSDSVAQEKILSLDYMVKVLQWSQTRITSIADLVSSKFTYVWVVPDNLPLQGLPPVASGYATLLNDLLRNVEETPDNYFNKEELSRRVKMIGKGHKLKTPAIMKFVRMAISGLQEGPPVGEMMEVLGKETTLLRLQHAKQVIS
ncbi:putative glutamate--tRNA ligase, mitochondrial [Oratosquilla oratoria]|uniref:putative glutamate--tRNA ligase, mitochondrial n=1 Tax=Oratosquilla oratoria TaxID=337810 RepID=UPI003F777BA2